jgi:hypothetical protein
MNHPFFRDPTFCFAHRAFCAADILARAEALIVRFFPPDADDDLGGRPRRFCCEPDPVRIAIAF